MPDLDYEILDEHRSWCDRAMRRAVLGGVPAKEMRPYNARLGRSTTLPNYDITIEPRAAKRQVK